MAGDEERSLRRRLTSSFKRVMSYKSTKSRDSASSVAEASRSASAPPAGAGPVKTSTPAPAAPAPAAPAEAAAGAAAQPTERPAIKPYRAPKVPVPQPPPMSAAERAQALFKKHGLDIKTSEWPLSTAPPGERVQKDIRMRVHRTCHKCETTYGPDPVCLKCNHKRCKKCPRHPTKKSKDKGKEKLTAKAPGYKKRRGDIAYGLTLPSRKGGQDLVRKAPRQRVHRKCHRCSTDFQAEKVCSNCNHNRCKLCPREPFKPHKAELYAKYDPSDSEPEVPQPLPPRRTYKKPRRRVHWICNKCDTTFIEKTKICTGCGSNRDDTGVRDPPKKPKYQPTEEELQRLNDRLKQTSISAT